MTTVSIQEAQDKLPELIHDLAPGDEVVITDNNLTVARLVAPIAKQQRPARQPGTLRGTVLHISPDFDAPLDEFRDYMG